MRILISFLISLMISTNCAYSDGIYFDAADDSISTGSSSLSAGVITVLAWVYPQTLSDYRGIVRHRTSSASSNFIWYITDDALGPGNVGQRIYWSAGIRASSGTKLTLNTWQHIGFVRSGSTGDWSVTFYLNGESDGTTSSITNNPTSVSATIDIGVSDFASTTWHGKIADVRIYERALKKEEINNIYKSRLFHVGGYPGYLPYAYFPMNSRSEGTSADAKPVYDRSGNGYHGTGSDGANNVGLTYDKNTVLSYP